MRKPLIATCLLLACGALAPASGGAAQPGSIDRSFAGGLLKFGFGLEPGDGAATQVGMQPDGKAIVLIPGTLAPFDYALARLTVTGDVDTSFGNGGYVSGGYGVPGARAVDLALQPDGKILVAGMVRKPNRFGVARYTPDGQLDSSFGDGGIAHFEGKPREELGVAGGMLLQPDGKIVLSGVDSGPLGDMHAKGQLELGRLHPDGGIDRSFGDKGVAIVPIPKGFRGSPAQALAWHEEKLTVAVGNGGYALLTRFTADGSLDEDFAAGDPIVALTRSHTTDLAVQPDGKAVVTGEQVTRLLSDGSRDSDFGSSGVVQMPTGFFANAVSLQPDGRILLAGVQRDEDHMPRDFALLRLNPDGSFDPTIGGGRGYLLTDVVGSQRDEAIAQAPLPGGGGLLVGLTYPEVGNYNRFTTVAAARYGSDGSLDPSFGGDGTVSVRPMVAANDMVFDLAVDEQGGVVATGRGGGRIATARFLPGGSLDPSFGTGGAVTATVSGSPLGEQGRSLVRYPDGRILVGTGSATGGALLRYLPDGSLDPGFGSGGVAITPAIDHVFDLELDEEGRIVVAGIGFGEPCQRVLARFDPSGTLDPTFGAGGALRKDLGGPCRTQEATLALAPGGRILFGAGLAYGSFLNAFTASGERIEGFGRGLDGSSDRVLPGKLRDVEVDKAGRIVAASVFDGAFGLVRLRPDGSADPSFGLDGRVKTRVQAWSRISTVRVQPNGKIVAAGISKRCRVNSRCTSPFLSIVRYNRDGSLDRNFGRSGISLRRVSFGADLSALALGPGTAVVGGWALASGESRQWILARLYR